MRLIAALVSDASSRLDALCQCSHRPKCINLHAIIIIEMYRSIGNRTVSLLKAVDPGSSWRQFFIFRCQNDIKRSLGGARVVSCGEDPSDHGRFMDSINIYFNFFPCRDF